MKKTLIVLALISSLIACKKGYNEQDKQTETQYLRIEEVDKDGLITVSTMITVKIEK
jgi:hypothetical protein